MSPNHQVASSSLAGRSIHALVAQLDERDLPKVEDMGSSPVESPNALIAKLETAPGYEPGDLGVRVPLSAPISRATSIVAMRRPLNPMSTVQFCGGPPQRRRLFS